MKSLYYITPIVLYGALCSNAVLANSNLEVVQDLTPFTVSAADENLNRQVIERLSSDEKILGDIAVSSKQGHVSLRGTVAEVAMIYRSVEKIRDMPGIVSVDVSMLDN